MEIIRFIKPEETYPIRKEVLRKNIDLPYQLDGDFDKDTFHIGVFVDDKLVSIVTFIQKNKEILKGEQFQLRGMATIEIYRGKGYAKMMIEKAENFLRNKNIHIVWCNARVEAIEFYKSVNYKKIGNVFEVPKVGKHYRMFKKL